MSSTENWSLGLKLYSGGKVGFAILHAYMRSFFLFHDEAKLHFLFGHLWGKAVYILLKFLADERNKLRDRT